MLNPFPQLLVYSFFIPTLLRLAATLAFLFIIQNMLMNRARYSELVLPLIGKPKNWLVWVFAVITLLAAFLLFIGLYTQLAAILGMLIALKYALLPNKYEPILMLPRAACWLLFAICLSLLFSGAGALAVDLPL